MEKRCPRCGVEKDAAEFQRSTRSRDGLQSWCRHCYSEHAREHRYSDPAYRARSAAYYRANRERIRVRNRAAHIRRRFDLSVDDYNAILAEQAGGCGICGQTEERHLAVDHDHGNGRVRGLLCTSCNRLLGIAGDSPDRLRGAARYLER